MIMARNKTLIAVITFIISMFMTLQLTGSRSGAAEPSGGPSGPVGPAGRLPTSAPSSTPNTSGGAGVVPLDTVPSGTYHEQVNQYVTTTRYCLDAATQTIGSNGGTVQLYHCLDNGGNYNGNSNQYWYIKTFSGNWAEIINGANGKCLDAKDEGQLGYDGDVVQMWSCLGTPNQLWKVSDTSATPNIVNQETNQCLDADSNNYGDGDKIQLWDCFIPKTGNQEWAQESIYYA